LEHVSLKKVASDSEEAGKATTAAAAEPGR
jgi:hypothetical protein